MYLWTKDGWRVTRATAACLIAGFVSACNGGGGAGESADESSGQMASQQLAHIDSFLFSPSSASTDSETDVVSAGGLPYYYGDPYSSWDDPSQEPQGDTDENAPTYPIQLSWQTSVTNVENECAADIVSYRFNFGLSPNYYTESYLVHTHAISCSALSTTACGTILQCSATVQVSEPASWYVAVQAIDQYGSSSDYSNMVVTTIYLPLSN